MGIKQLKSAPAGLQGSVQVPGDKSMSHRAVMFGSVANGQTKITGLLASEDIERTMTVFQQMGVSMTQEDGCWLIDGIGFDGLHAPQEALDMGNSGTTTRLLLGLLAGSAFPLTFYGDQSLSKRPLGRVLTPLKDMGVMLQTETNALPVTLTGKVALHGISYTLPMASAQVKSAILLAGLQASGTTTVIEPMPTRDHTERMLREFGVDVTVRDNAISVQGGPQLTGTNVIIPGDMSSAAFWLTAGLLVPNSQITITQVGVNPTRVGLLRLLERMGANFPALATSDDVEPVMDLQVATQDLQAITVTAEDVPQAIDEMPLLVLAATQAKGTTVISGASELRVKESDRITAVTTELNKLGAHIEERPDGFVIHGGTPLAVSEPTIVEVYDDHRIGMMLAIAALITDGEVQLSDGNVVDISYPTFFNDLEKLMQ
ncbi:3-phosphoshikimate 1-carboxyvinyltransferase [Weissella tructae]|uniref:3-phosphoshikimate 1-carboxyvinyltransferase n=2 Tax=Weissella TaxID=46255 RepID=A0A088GGN8_9LACO|nr:MULTISPECIES: 3-phosphoshikimate 1-carboxyvinyltransferase [Weissella]AIG65767.1 3-phosphoshikimate 1-carboxyvinyltransferase [Weissella tructae]AIM63146.2 3-phosphoshikimate 1-carboxyvinyltransferase [Weissella ceti]AIM64482.1 3-phosphoshikimate 1-carboxyvinyltransferase [Weissella ceti]QVV90929.1 3-phosphoshikimate 1-carboxyvinyltransferase [Weissella tructae]